MLVSNRKLAGFLYLAPALLFVSVFVLHPLKHLIHLSMTDESLLGGGQWVGFADYLEARDDRSFWTAFWCTVRYTLIVTSTLLILGFLLPLLVMRTTALARLTRGIVFVPVVIGLASSSLLWVWLFNQQVGLFNQALVDLGVIEEPIVWLNKAHLGMTAVIIFVVSEVVGFGVILMLAGMQSISHEVVEASMIDSAT